MCTGVGLGSAVPPFCSLSSLSLGASFPPLSATLSASLPSVPAFPASASFAAPPPPLAPLPPPFPGPSPFVASFLSSLSMPAPPGFHITPPVHPLTPPMGLHPHGPSLNPSVAPFFSVFSFLEPAPGALPFLPTSCLFLLCCRLPPKLGETAKVYR